MRMWNFWLLLMVLSLFAASCAPTVERDDEGTITTEGNIDVFKMHVGDCFDDEALFDSDETVELTGVAGIPCSEPHDNEVYAVFDVGFSNFPGDEEMAEATFDLCLERFEEFVGRSYETSALDIFPIYPTSQSWTQEDDREVICAVYDIEGQKLEGSARGSEI
jgi:hypothetical protein